MNKEQAKQIIKETFEQPFNKNRFVSFIKNLLNQIEESTFSYHGPYIPDAYRPFISIFERVGKFNDGENRLDILIVKLTKDTSFERARTRQRNFIAGYLQGKYGSSNKKDAALVAFISPNDADWRFSLIRMDYRFEETTTGKIKIEEEFTPARRWSFLVGVNEKSHTAQSQLVDMLADDEKSPNLSELEKAFNIEIVTKEFFLQYRDLFIRTKESLDEIVNNCSKIEEDFKEKNINTVDFAKKLLGQIVFLYFLQKKGWFGLERDADWGTGSKQFLRELFEKKHGDYTNFFNDILEPLFYQALRIDRSHDYDYYSHFKSKIPFLNGGLFDPIGNYDWVHTDILLPDNLFSNHNKTKQGDIGDGILDIFDRYNFTVQEDEPLEKEVAIDPELLGKAYEKFNAIRPDNFDEYKEALKSGKKGEENKFNKQYGVYYTPREIVHYMCQQSLINYLATESKISKDDIETLVQLGEQVTENEARVLKAGKETTTYSYKLPESIRVNASLIDSYLKNITVCDPAVGSGAFPVGMMSEIVKVRNVLTSFINDNERTPYEFKRRCIEHSLYGVDIDPGAVEIAKLRLWLSLVVDEDDIKNIKPLPNLDYKIVCGNSLLGVEKNMFNHEIFNKLEELKPLYFNETNPTRKQELKEKIDGLINQITNRHKEFDFEIYFSEVFHHKGGFDVIIANPPYFVLRGSKLSDKILIEKAKHKRPECLGRVNNIYRHFISNGLEILRTNGILSYITQSSFLGDLSAVNLRRHIFETSKIIMMMEFPEKAHVFEQVTVASVVFLLSKGFDDNQMFPISYNNDPINLNKTEWIELPKKLIELLSDSLIVPIGLTSQEIPILKKIYENKKRVGCTVITREGDIHQTKHKKFMVEKETTTPLLIGRDFTKYFIAYNQSSMFFDLNRYIKTLEEHRKTQFLKDIREKRIVIQGIVNMASNVRLKAALISPQVICGNSLNILYLQEEGITNIVLALLNSRVLNWCFKRTSSNNNINNYEIKQLPIPEIKTQKKVVEKIISETNNILSILQSNDSLKQAKVKQYEHQIDQLVYKLYGLTEDEIKIIENKHST